MLQGRLSGQAPEVDPVVFFTDCDPTDYPAGTFVDVEVVDAAGYDLIVRPVEALAMYCRNAGGCPRAAPDMRGMRVHRGIGVPSVRRVACPHGLPDGRSIVVQSTIGVQATLPEWAALPTLRVSGVAVSST